MFSDNYIALCAKSGEHVTAVAEKLGFSRSAGQKWANGATPRISTLKRIADYFGVTVDELTANAKQPVPTDGNGLNDREKLVLSLFNRLPAANQEVVIAQLQGLVQFQEAQDARSKSE